MLMVPWLKASVPEFVVKRTIPKEPDKVTEPDK
jgi:hypothetical protein